MDDVVCKPFHAEAELPLVIVVWRWLSAMTSLTCCHGDTQEQGQKSPQDSNVSYRDQPRKYVGGKETRSETYGDRIQAMEQSSSMKSDM